MKKWRSCKRLLDQYRSRPLDPNPTEAIEDHTHFDFESDTCRTGWVLSKIRPHIYTSSLNVDAASMQNIWFKKLINFHLDILYLKVARPSSNPTWKMAGFSVSVLCFMTFQGVRKNWGSLYSFRQKLRSNLLFFFFFAGFCMWFNCKSKCSPLQTVAAKLYLEFFFQNPPQPSWYISLGIEKEKMAVTGLVFALRTKELSQRHWQACHF